MILNSDKKVVNRVAVIMSVYHGDKLAYLKSAVKSILEQTYEHIDLYIYKDGEVEPKVAQYLVFLAGLSNVSVFGDSENKGLAKGLNYLIEKVVNAGGYRYIARMDADDISRLDRIEKQVNFMNKNKELAVSGTSCTEFGATFSLAEKHLPAGHEELIQFSVARCPFIHPTVIFRIELFCNGLRYPTNTSFTEDMALWLRLLDEGYKFGNLNEILLDYRLDESTVKRRKGFKKALSEVVLRQKYMKRLNMSSFRNFILVYSRLFFHLAPDYLVKLLYKYFR
ncbi:glycosyltransferase [Vibrio parahaemolyticus]|uniref:glycosyltransferase n=1 Tax=Vibrio TaxID=662 RepID=UPI0005F1E3EF|nr:glycosyltransferase [Vibrio parahaemolyticus]EIU7851289.1 glycosyltransferase [Vibrio parahaemolyticus]EIY7830985.1 glycosyltransferase [Vibrio parahaemolyticus]MBE4194327.1 glycosyltransferase [Vibrio parahaemolyticus]MBO0151996.1 glycosyltransferase [Vibrio parahaemolyticus]MDF5476928.1 glycosyltransferase [Vibrio parahaemolyticus]